MIQKLEAVIFDMDGTILDTERSALTSLRYAGELIGIDLTDQILHDMIGLNENDSHVLMEKRLGVEVPQELFRKTFYKDYENTLVTKGFPLKTGAKGLINFLREKNVRLAIATSSNKAIARRKLGQAGLLEHFEFIISGDEVSQGKPAAEPYLKAVEVLGTSIDKCLALEDSDNGTLSAVRAGINVIVVPDIKLPSEHIRKLALKICTSLIEAKKWIEKKYDFL